MNRKKVLHISYGGLGRGGVSSVILSIGESLRAYYDFGCVVFNSIGSREEIFAEYGRLHRLNCYPKNGRHYILEPLLRPFRMFFGVFRICREEGYEVIHAHNGEEIGFCLLAAKCAGVQIRIAHAHNTPSPKKQPAYKCMQQWLNRFLIARTATNLVGCSAEACRNFFCTDNFQVVCNSVDLTRFNIHKRQPHEGVCFIHVGRFCYQKNQSHVIDTFYHINQKMPQSHLYLVGFGQDEELLRQQIVDLSLETHVDIIPGDRVPVETYYALADYMIFPSFYEGVGIVLIEAQAMGIRCFVSNAVQKEADVGLLTYINLEKSPEEWAQIILSTIHNTQDIDELVEKRLKAYDYREMARQYDSIYQGENYA